ncbi:DUF4232 domain-containing protein [Streptomyces sp. NPDC093252]|uniref:DUF4232 domain-containing protein n=1 Tax=Streptomyces sp. NPDC093252 TaxID=3154980 RepID=UPI003413BB68
MRARPLSLTVLALAGALLLGACGGDDSGDDSGDGGAADGKASAASAAPGACAIGDLTVEAGPAAEAPADGDTGNVPVTLTNQGEDCVLDGFPGVKLEGGDAAVDIPADEAATAQQLTLAKDVTATFTVTYVRGTGGVDAEQLRVSLPGGDQGAGLPWSYGPVAAEGGVPEASVSAFQQAGD